MSHRRAHGVAFAAGLMLAMVANAGGGGTAGPLLQRTFPNLDVRGAGTTLQFNYGVVQVRRVRLPTLVAGVASEPTWIVVQRNGRMFVVRDPAAATVASPVMKGVDPTWAVRDLSNSEEGYYSLAIDPDAGTNPARAFAYYTTGRFGSMDLFRAPIVVAARAGGGLDWTLGAPTIVMRVNAGGNHYGGDLAFGPDGFLYLSTGDNEQLARTQSPANTLGKVLRIDVHQSGLTASYGVPADNPWRLNGMGMPNAPCNDSSGLEAPPDYPHACPEVFAVGFRNPFRFGFDRVGGAMWLGDVGAEHEEIDRVAIGMNYGWNTCEGTTCGVPQLVPAVAEIPRAGCTVEGYAIIGGTVYRGSSEALRGSYIAADSAAGKLYAIADPYGTPAVSLIHGECADAFFHPSAFTEDESGELYVSSLDPTPGRAFWRITSDAMFADGVE